MAWKYRPDEITVLKTEGVPTSAQSEYTLCIDRLTGIEYVNQGGGSSTWTTRAAGAVETLITTRVLTLADSGKTFFLNLAGGFTVTLPVTTTAAGFRCLFWVKTSPTTAYIVTGSLGSSEDTIVGWPINCGGADSVANGNAAGDLLNFVANTALAGDYAEFFCDGAVWYVRAVAKAIGAITITG